MLGVNRVGLFGAGSWMGVSFLGDPSAQLGASDKYDSQTGNKDSPARYFI